MSPKRRILIADDDPDILAMLSLRLLKAGYDVVKAAEGSLVLALVRETKPDLVILDYFLPNVKGDEICLQIKADSALRAIPVILLSASTAALPPETVHAIPTDDRLTKPFDISILLEKIRLLLPAESAG
ncbi:MAG: response regulator [Elusimicrobia bacterium]|nr:response regulator [Elusimicrobiota bacterium]